MRANNTQRWKTENPERCPSCGTVIRPTGECRCSD